MNVYAYLRISTDEQDARNQKHGILEYANRQQITGIRFIEDRASGKTNWRERRIGHLLEHEVREGDLLLMAEVSRMARSTLQVLEILQQAAEMGVTVHIAKQNMAFDNSINAKIAAVVLGLAAEIEREFVTMRTKESLAEKKKQIEEKGYFITSGGKRCTALGRPKGKAKHVKLDQRENEIRGYLSKGISKRAIAKLVDCSPSTLYSWFKRKGIKI